VFHQSGAIITTTTTITTRVIIAVVIIAARVVGIIKIAMKEAMEVEGRDPR
jgi:hypothetical protein